MPKISFSNKSSQYRDPRLRTLRIPGVLQRFGFAYLIVGLIQAIFANRELPSLSEQHVEENTIPWWWPARDIKVKSI